MKFLDIANHDAASSYVIHRVEVVDGIRTTKLVDDGRALFQPTCDQKIREWSSYLLSLIEQTSQWLSMDRTPVIDLL